MPGTGQGDQPSPVPVSLYMEVLNVKSTLLLATTLFLISAPAPDSGDIAEITSNFIVPEDVPGLMAAEEAPDSKSLESIDLNESDFQPVESGDTGVADQDLPAN